MKIGLLELLDVITAKNFSKIEITLNENNKVCIDVMLKGKIHKIEIEGSIS